MTPASYNDIAQWYDQFLRERPVYTEVILPNLLRLIGEIEGEVICDLACGQGWVARELARRGAQVTGLDLAPNLLALARGYEEQEPLGIVYVQGGAERAEPLSDRQFTGCVCVMALINIPDLQATFQSVRRFPSLLARPFTGRFLEKRWESGFEPVGAGEGWMRGWGPTGTLAAQRWRDSWLKRRGGRRKRPYG